MPTSTGGERFHLRKHSCPCGTIDCQGKSVECSCRLKRSRWCCVPPSRPVRVRLAGHLQTLSHATRSACRACMRAIREEEMD